MKNIQSKSLLTLIIIFFIIGFSTSAKDILGIIGNDFTGGTLSNKPSYASLPDSAAPDTPVIKNPLIRNPHWVIYPVSLEEHRDESKDYVKHYSRRERGYIMYMFKKGKHFFPKAASILEKYDVPEELQVLPALESNFNANAVSAAGAVGYWQFMSELAGEYGLHTGGNYDERKNFTKSTVAAAKFFRDQLDTFNGDLLLTVAAFNCGQGRVRSSISKCGKANADFWDIKKYLPAETRTFVMRFIALNVISANYEKFLKHKLNFEEPALIQLADADSSLSDISLSRNSL